MAHRQPEQQPQRILSETYRCPSCRANMKMVGRETVHGSSTFNVFTFQCPCGQIIATRQ